MDKVDLMSCALFPRAIGKRQLWLATASLLAFAANPAAAQDAAKGQVARPPAVPTLPTDPDPPGEPDLQTPVVPPLPTDAPRTPAEDQTGFAADHLHYDSTRAMVVAKGHFKMNRDRKSPIPGKG